MAHLGEGTLQAYLDEEVTGRERAAAAEHLLACAECRRQLDALKRANERLAAALAELDVARPAAEPRHRLSGRRWFALGGGSVLRAAVLVLLVAAAASATVPGSPVRDWIVQVVGAPERAPETPAPPVPPVDSTPATPAPSAPAGIVVPDARDVDLVVTGLEGVAIRLVRVETGGLAVSARGGEEDPLFRLAPGRIEVVGGSGGELLIEVPVSGVSLRLEVDGRRYAELSDGELRVLVSGAREGGAVTWP